MSFVFSGWRYDSSFSVCSTENVLCSIRVTENASGTPMVGGLNVDNTNKSCNRGSMETEEKGIRTCDATLEIILWPKGLLVRLIDSSRLGAYNALPGDFLDVCHVQYLSPITPHPEDIGNFDSFVELAVHSESLQMSFLNVANRFLVLPYPISQIETGCTSLLQVQKAKFHPQEKKSIHWRGHQLLR